jgi:hypothetical protein
VTPIEPDTKDWTWVLQRGCPECGFDTTTITGRDVPRLIRANAAAWVDVLQAPRDVHARDSEDRWSALEYACHVRDVYRLFNERLALMVDEDDPTFANWDQDATAVADDYGAQDPGVVGDELAVAAAAVAGAIDELTEGDWARTGARSDGAQFTVDTFTRYLIHDTVHHLYDVGAPGT